MAGPSATVLLPTPPDDAEFHAWLARAFDPDGFPGWWRLRDPYALGLSSAPATGPMLIEPGPWADEDDLATPGFTPATEIVLAAGVNGPADHRLLAELALTIATRYQGLISLDGRLPVPPPPGVSMLAALETDEGRREWAASSRELLATLPGRWHEIPYRLDGDDISTYHVVDVELLTAWLRHPQFRMVK